MQVTYRVVTPAKESSLLSVYECKLALGLPSGDPSKDNQLELLIKWASDEVSTLCGRVFARETVVDTFREFGQQNHVYLTHFPVEAADVTSVSEGNGAPLDPTLYEINEDGGIVSKLSGLWNDPVIVSYTGGYDLPLDAPPALAQAVQLLTREAYYANLRGDQTVRMVGHKESRIIYFDPAAMLRASLGGAAGKAGSPARRAVSDLLFVYTRLWC